MQVYVSIAFAFIHPKKSCQPTCTLDFLVKLHAMLQAQQDCPLNDNLYIVLILIILCFVIILKTMPIRLNCFYQSGHLLVGGLGLSFFVYVFVNAGMVSVILAIYSNSASFF